MATGKTPLLRAFPHIPNKPSVDSSQTEMAKTFKRVTVFYTTTDHPQLPRDPRKRPLTASYTSNEPKKPIEPIPKSSATSSWAIPSLKIT